MGNILRAVGSAVCTLVAICGLLHMGPTQASNNTTIELVVPFEKASAMDLLAKAIAEGLQAQQGTTVRVKNIVGTVRGKSAALEYVRRADPQRHVYLLGNPATMVNWDLKAHQHHIAHERGFAAISHVVDYEYGVVVADRVTTLSGIAAPTSVAWWTKNTKDDEAEVALVPSATDGAKFAVATAEPTPVQRFEQVLQWIRSEDTPVIGVTDSNAVATLLAYTIAQDARVNLKLAQFANSRNLVAGLQEGKAHVVIDMLPVIWPLQNSAGIRLLAVSSERRLSRLPDTPTLNELGFGMDASGWGVLFASERMPPKRRQFMEEALQNLFKDPEFGKKIKQLFFTPVGTDAQTATRMVDDFTHLWAPIAKKAILQPK